MGRGGRQGRRRKHSGVRRESVRPARDDVASAQQRAQRYRRERVAGRVGFAVAGVGLVLNLVMEIVPELSLLPGGHSELYFLVTVAGMAAGVWFGFDLGLRERRR